MSAQTKIEWCDASWSPWLGCSKVSPGCAHCYITTTTALRVRGLKHGEPRERTSESYWKQPARWNREALIMNHRPRIFPSLCDWIDDEVPIEWLADFLRVIYETPNLDWLLLTKRLENWSPRLKACADIGSQLAIDWLSDGIDRNSKGAPPNVWIGTSVENQKYADERIPALLKIPARVRFLSVEPLLGPIKIRAFEADGDPLYLPNIAADIHLVIVGGESGPGARLCNIEWIRDIKRQCEAALVPLFCKQLGSFVVEGQEPARRTVRLKHPKGGDPSEWPEDLRVREFPNET